MTFILLNKSDNVAITLHQAASGLHDSELGIQCLDDIPPGHKVAIMEIPEGSEVLKFGQCIGVATRTIRPGEHVHLHNLGMSVTYRDTVASSHSKVTAYMPESEIPTFQGYRRKNGSVGTRNYIALITSVNCSATVAHHIRRTVERSDLIKSYPNVDGVVALTHGGGCCIGTDDEGFRMLQRTIWGHAEHPNFGAVLLIGLGCEANQISMMLRGVTPESHPLLHSLVIQEEGGTEATVSAAMDWLEAVLPEVNKMEREPVSAKELKVALQCGGSDGYSAITANPALGLAVDRLVACGGTAVLAETTEIYGAEHLLIRRAVNHSVGQEVRELIKWWEDYAVRLGSEINNNPTPGNKAGGLTTILEKSLGAVAKAGSTNLNSVLRYAETIDTNGLLFMDSPGYDPCSITGQVASGCNLVAFTTGRGSCYGNKPAPTLKIATNTPMYMRMSDDMDINAGTIVDRHETLEDVGNRIFNSFISIASGKKTLSEQHEFGDAEFVPWQISAQM